MKLVAALICAWLLGALASVSAAAQPADQGVRARDAQAQSQRASRPRTRLRIGPRYPYRHTHSLYPLPYDIESPGPNAKRDCVARYVTEHRPSGTVTVPRVRCRWVRG